jgi:hypothetical protein
MTNGYRAVVWVNHSEAKVYRFSGDEESESDVHSHTSLQRLHHRPGGWEAGGNTPDDAEFFGRIHGALEQSDDIVITGPGNAKTALKAFLDHMRPDVVSHVLTSDSLNGQSTAGPLLALGRKFFAAAPIREPIEKSRVQS